MLFKRILNSNRLILLPLICFLFLSGCWDRQEISDLAQVWAIGIDKNVDIPGNYVLTLQVTSPQEAAADGGGGGGQQSGEEKAVWVLSSECQTISDALDVANQVSPRKLYFGHTRAIVFGEELAREGIREILDYFQRDRSFRRTIRLLVARGSTAQRILEANPRLEKVPSVALMDILGLAEQSGNTLTVKMGDFLLALANPGSDPLCGSITVNDNRKVVLSENMDPQDSSENGETRGFGVNRNSLELRIAGNAIFAGDRVVDWLDSQEIKGCLIVKNKLKYATLLVYYPEDDTKITFRTFSCKSKIIPQFNEGKLSFLIKVKLKVALIEQLGELNPSSAETFSQIEQVLEELVQEKIYRAIGKAQKNKADIFGFGTTLYRKHPQLWKENYQQDWPETFAQLPVNLELDLIIRNTGITTAGVKTTR
jgi:spore germination protein KC